MHADLTFAGNDDRARGKRVGVIGVQWLALAPGSWLLAPGSWLLAPELLNS